MGWGAGKGLGWDFSFQDQGDTRSARHLVKDLQRLQVRRPFRPVGAGAVSYTGGLSSCHPQPFVPTHSPWLWEGEKECYFFSSLSLCLFFFFYFLLVRSVFGLVSAASSPRRHAHTHKTGRREE